MLQLWEKCEPCDRGKYWEKIEGMDILNFEAREFVGLDVNNLFMSKSTW